MVRSCDEIRAQRDGRYTGEEAGPSRPAGAVGAGAAATVPEWQAHQRCREPRKPAGTLEATQSDGHAEPFLVSEQGSERVKQRGRETRDRRQETRGRPKR